jgi:hypothetical protein
MITFQEGCCTNDRLHPLYTDNDAVDSKLLPLGQLSGRNIASSLSHVEHAVLCYPEYGVGPTL